GAIGGYAGGGVGYADVKQFGSSKGKFAWQLLAGVYYPVSDNFDVGLKYRYFRAGRTSGRGTVASNSATATCGTTAAPFPCSGGVATFDNDSGFSLHSLLLSLVYKFGAAAALPAPPTPPPQRALAAPATNTCRS